MPVSSDYDSVNNGVASPPTDYQRNQARKTLIESLDPDAICALASSYNGGEPSRIVGKAGGSFNVCFFIEFTGGSQWVARICLEAARIDDSWNKLLSEVTTIHSSPQMFLITDLIPGKALEKGRLAEATDECSRAFYSQLIDILADLRNLEFPAAGSLHLNAGGSDESPVLGPLLSISAATLGHRPRPAFNSAKEFMEYQFDLISEFFVSPVCDHTIEDIRKEISALHSMRPLFPQAIVPQLDEDPSVLNHLDLRSANMIVDDAFQIQGIIDWEFAATVPRQMFTPPSWITGHDSNDTARKTHRAFRAILDEKSQSSDTCRQLRAEWYGAAADCEDTDEINRTFALAHVLRRPTDLTDIFYDFFAQGLPTLEEGFKDHPELADEAQSRADQCENYTTYLKEKGLYKHERKTDMGRLLAMEKELKAKWNWA